MSGLRSQTRVARGLTLDALNAAMSAGDMLLARVCNRCRVPPDYDQRIALARRVVETTSDMVRECGAVSVGRLAAQLKRELNLGDVIARRYAVTVIENVAAVNKMLASGGPAA